MSSDADRGGGPTASHHWLAVAVLTTLVGCSATPSTLVVDLRTDYQGFSTVEVALDGRVVTTPIADVAPFVEGARIAEFTDLEARRHRLRVTLFDDSGAGLATQELLVQVGPLTGVTVLMTRSCQGVECDPSSPLPACVGGVCESAECAPEVPGSCVRPRACDRDDECSAGADPCDAPRCSVDGDCFLVPIQNCSPSSCPEHPDALLCLDFESPMSDPVSIQSSSFGLVDRTEEQAFNGSFALRTSVDTGSSGHPLEHGRLIFPVPGVEALSTLYVRAQVFLEPDAAPPNWIILFNHFGDMGKVSAHVHSGDRAAVVSNATETVRAEQADARTVPRGRWFCLEFGMTLDDIEGALEMSIDGETITEARSIDTIPPTGFLVLGIGTEIGPSGDPHRTVVYYDDLVVSETPIGCAP